MKKTIVITVFISLFTSGIALAASLASGAVTPTAALSLYGGKDTSDSASNTTSTLIGKTSNGVKMGVNYTGTSYALDTKHTSGGTAYGTASDATAIYKSEIGLTATLSAPSAADYTSFSAWTAM